MWGSDLDIGQVVQRTIIDEPIVLYRKTDGTVAAITDQCSHRFAPLSRGKVCGDHLECPYHGLQFGADGQCVVNPHGSGRITPQLHLRAYPLVERHTLLWIWMGDQPANPDLIPDFSHLDEGAPGIVSKRDWMVIDVDYRLMADNLLDLSHVNFLHEGLLGHAGMIDAEVEMRDEIEPSRHRDAVRHPHLARRRPAVPVRPHVPQRRPAGRHMGRDALERPGLPAQPRRRHPAGRRPRGGHGGDRLAPADPDQRASDDVPHRRRAARRATARSRPTTRSPRRSAACAGSRSRSRTARWSRPSSRRTTAPVAPTRSSP